MSLTVLGWREVLKALRKKRFYATRQSGSHIIVENGEGLWTAIREKMSLIKGILTNVEFEHVKQLSGLMGQEK